MRELLREVLAGEEAWIIGGAVRDELLGRPVLDVDVACGDPEQAAHGLARHVRGISFLLSERHGAWRVVGAGDATVDFTPLPNGIVHDLSTRDFGLNAIAIAVGGGEELDPYGGRADVAARAIRAVSDSVFTDDPLRLLRAVRLEDELGFRMDERTERLVRESARLVVEPAGERILAELLRCSADGYRRLAELSLLAPLGGSTEGPLDAIDTREFRLVAALGISAERLPISNALRRYARAVLQARAPEDASARAVHRFRRRTEPWALEALAFVRASEHAAAIVAARRADPAEPLVRGDELPVAPGPERGRILEVIEEERAAGTISTRDEALALARRLAERSEDKVGP
jgi:Poly A polymerase head domain